MNGVYWGLTALHLLGSPDGLPRDETISFVLSCQHETGGFGAAPGHDPHMLYTVSAVQILATVDALDELDKLDRLDKGGKTSKEKIGSCMTDKSRTLTALNFPRRHCEPTEPRDGFFCR